MGFSHMGFSHINKFINMPEKKNQNKWKKNPQKNLCN